MAGGRNVISPAHRSQRAWLRGAGEGRWTWALIGRWAALLVFLIGPSVLFVGHFLYAVAHAEIYLHGVERAIRYGVAPLAVVAAYVLLITLVSPRVRVLVATYSYAVLAGLLMFEVYPYFAGRGYEPPLKADKLFELRASGQQAYPAFPVLPVLHEMGIVGSDDRDDAIVTNLPEVPTVLCRGDDGEWVWFEADRHGFNNPPGAPGEDAGRGLPVAVVGDSFIQGICLPEKDSIVGQLRARGVEARSFGITGHGPLLELETLKRWVQPYRPKDVVWCFFAGNDLQDLEVERKLDWLVEAADAKPYRPPDERRAAAVERFRTWLDQEIANPPEDARGPRVNWVSVLALRRFFSLLGLHYGRATRDLDLFARTLASAKELVEGWGGRLHFCYLPDSVRYRGLLPADAAYETSKEAVLGVVRDLGINVMDVSARFERHPTPKSLFDKPGHHYTPEGAALAAETIAHGLPAEELLVQHSRR